MNKKYELIKDDFIEVYSGRIFRIRALRDFGDVKKGDIGGYIQSENNLSKGGDCWVYDNAWVFDDAKVCDNAMVCDSARVCDNAMVCDNARVFGYAMIFDNARVYGDGQIFGNEKVFGNITINYERGSV